MAFWQLECANCKKEFDHSPVKVTSVEDIFLPRKPEFPPGGSELECPHCKTMGVYNRHQLTFRR